ncbi:MAG: hypothetical protein ACRC57_13375 [Sarcina sp.]
MNDILITDFIKLQNGFKFSVNQRIELSSLELFIYIDNNVLSTTQFTITKDSQNELYFVINFLEHFIFDSLVFYIFKDNINSNLSITFYRLHEITFDNKSFTEHSFTLPSNLNSSNYEMYGFKFNDNPILSNNITFTFCNGINTVHSYITLLSSTLDEYTFKIELFDKNYNHVPDSNYQIEIRR